MGRLAMRPWQVFIAQLLQFQDQLGSAWPDPGRAGPGTPVGQSVRADVSNQLTEALQLIETRKLREPTDLLKDALAVLSGAKPPVSVTSLLDLGFDGSAAGRVPPGAAGSVSPSGSGCCSPRTRDSSSTIIARTPSWSWLRARSTRTGSR